LSSWHGIPAGFSSFAAGVVPLLATGTVAALVLGVALSTRLGAVRREAAEGRFWRGLAVGLLGVPTLAMAAAAVFPLTPVGKALLILMGIAPGAPMLLNKARASKGNVPLAVLLSVALSFCSAALVPAGIAVANRLFSFALRGSVAAVARTLLPSLWGPLAVGLGLRAVWPGAADRLAPVARALAAVGLGVLGVLVFVSSWRYVATPTPWAWVAVVALTVGAAAMGDRAAGGRPEDQRTVAYAVVLGNPSLAILVARESYPEMKLAPFVIIFAVVRALVLIVWDRVAIRRGSRDARGASGYPTSGSLG
jgi:predicted Na+-dependent transporter